VQYHEKGDYYNALYNYQNSLKINPYDLETKCNLANVYYTLKEYDKAVQEYTDIIKMNQTLQTARKSGIKTKQLKKRYLLNVYYYMGNSYYLLKNYISAAQCFQTVLSMEPLHAETLNILGAIYYRTGKNEKAIQKFQAALKINPDFVTARENLALVFSKTGEYEKALNEWSILSKLKPEDAVIQKNINSLKNTKKTNR